MKILLISILFITCLLTFGCLSTKNPDQECAKIIFATNSSAPLIGHSSGHLNVLASISSYPNMTYDCYQDSIGPSGIDWRYERPELASQINYTKNYGSVQIGG